MGSLDDIGEIWLQFHHLAGSVDDIDAVVIVEEQRTVVEVAHAGNE